MLLEDLLMILKSSCSSPIESLCNIFCVVFGFRDNLSNIFVLDFSNANFFIEVKSLAFIFPLMYSFTPDIIFFVGFLSNSF